MKNNGGLKDILKPQFKRFVCLKLKKLESGFLTIYQTSKQEFHKKESEVIDKI